MKEHEECNEKWRELAKTGKLISFRFKDTRKAPVGLVFETDTGKLILKAKKDSLILEPYW